MPPTSGFFFRSSLARGRFVSPIPLASRRARPCSCTASLREDAPSSSPKTKTVAHHPPKPSADHRELAVRQKLFVTSPYSPGSPLLSPNGADMFIKLQNLLRGLYPRFGFREVITPTIYKRSLWEKSGHWENYAEDMFEVRGRGASGRKTGMEIGEDEEFGLKPMNCPGHCLLFASENRSYRDLPIRFADFSALHRNEVSGSLSGLTRVRRFHQDDAHIFCRPSQVGDEIRTTLDFVDLIYSQIFDFGPYRLVLSTRPTDNFIGTTEEWDRAENQLRDALVASGQEWSINQGDGAFYGPKIDIILKDSDGKEHQTATVQLDFQLPQRFDLKYLAPNVEAELAAETSVESEDGSVPGAVTPIIIHRAILGSLERFMALLIEHYNGVYPLWLAPHSIKILTANGDADVESFARKVCKTLESPFPGSPTDSSSGNDMSIASEAVHLHPVIDGSNRRLAKKVLQARMEGYNFVLVIGKQEVADGTIMISAVNQRKLDMAEKLLGERAVGQSDAGGSDWKVKMPVAEAHKFFYEMCRYRI